MSLLKSIQSQLAVAPSPPPQPAAPPAPDTVIDIDQRNAIIRATLAVSGDAKAQAAVWAAMSGEMNAATLTAAVRLLATNSDEVLAARFGAPAPAPVMRTAAEWRELSPFKSDGTYTVVDLKCR